MNGSLTNYSASRRARGATLIEVLGGLALLSSLLVAILFAQAGYTRQSAIAERRTRAVSAADELLQGWWRQPERFPVSTSGVIAGSSGLSWKTRLVSTTGLQNLEAQVVRLDIIDERGTSRDAPPLVSVDVVLPIQSRPQ
jgi:type II secretory pathway pseudopilin PulG